MQYATGDQTPNPRHSLTVPNVPTSHFDPSFEQLALAMHKYNQYVRRLVPEDFLLQVDFFTAALLPNSTRAEWSQLQSSLILKFVTETEAESKLAV